jgi:predicted amidohydrolase
MTIVKAALLQTDWSGDQESMTDKHEEAAREAAEQGAQVMCFQELFYGPYFCQVQDAQYYSRTGRRRSGSRASPKSSAWSWCCRCTRSCSPGCTTTPPR